MSALGGPAKNVTESSFVDGGTPCPFVYHFVRRLASIPRLMLHTQTSCVFFPILFCIIL